MELARGVLQEGSGIGHIVASIYKSEFLDHDRTGTNTVEEFWELESFSVHIMKKRVDGVDEYEDSSYTFTKDILPFGLLKEVNGGKNITLVNRRYLKREAHLMPTEILGYDKEYVIDVFCQGKKVAHLSYFLHTVSHFGDMEYLRGEMEEIHELHDERFPVYEIFNSKKIKNFILNEDEVETNLCYIEKMEVAEAYRGKGFFEALFNALLYQLGCAYTIAFKASYMGLQYGSKDDIGKTKWKRKQGQLVNKYKRYFRSRDYSLKCSGDDDSVFVCIPPKTHRQKGEVR